MLLAWMSHREKVRGREAEQTICLLSALSKEIMLKAKRKMPFFSQGKKKKLFYPLH